MRLMPRYPWILLFSVGLAFMVWYGTVVERREKIAEKLVEASLTLVNVPPDMVITSDVPRSLSLRVRGSLTRLTTLDPSQTGVVIDLRGAGEGDHDFSVDLSNVVVPAGIEVVAVVPSQISLHLERVVQRRVEVEARITGTPAQGYAAGPVSVTPPTVVVSGPRTQLQSLTSVATDAVSIDGATQDVISVVPVRSPHPLVRIVEPTVVRVAVPVVAEDQTDQSAQEGRGR